MSTTTIPTVNPSDDHIVVSWVDGRGQSNFPHIVPADFQSVESMHGVMTELISHTYLLGMEHADLDVVRREMVDLYQLGYGDGMQEEMPGIPSYTDNPLGNQMYTAGRNARRETGRLREQLEGVGAMLTQRNHRITELEEALASALRVCDTKDSDFADLTAENVRLKDAVDQWQMAATDAGQTELLDRNRRQTEIIEQGQRDLEARDARITTLQGHVDSWQADFDRVGEMLLQEAQRRDWCSDYDRFVESVNTGLTHGALWTRERNFTATIELTVSFTLEHGVDEHDNASNIGAAINRNGDNLGGMVYEITDWSVDNVYDNDD